MSVDSTLAGTQLDALISMLEESILFLDDAAVVTSCTVGSNRWMNPAGLLGKRWGEILPGQGDTQSAKLLDRAATEGVQTVEQLIRPSDAPLLKSAGLISPRWFRVSTARAESGWLVTLKDISTVRQTAVKGASMSQRDIMTGAYNRRALMPVIRQAVAQAQRYDWICSILVVEIDSLEKVVDRHGLDAGDQLMRSLVTVLTAMKRTADFLARIGDNQLALFLPETNREQSLLASARVLNLAREMKQPIGGETVKFTVSIGAATLNGLDDSADKMLSRAEVNLHIAAQSGGNRAEGEES